MFKPSPERAFRKNARRLWKTEGKLARQGTLKKRKEDAALASCGIGSPGMANLDSQSLEKMGSMALDKIAEKTAPCSRRIAKLGERRVLLYASCARNVSEMGEPASSRICGGSRAKDGFLREVIIAFSIVTAAKVVMIAAGVGLHLGATIALVGTVAIYLAWRYALQRIIIREQNKAAAGKAGAGPDRLAQLFMEIKDSLAAGAAHGG